MAVRVQTNADIIFGIMAAEQTATHARVQDNTGNDPIVRELAAPVTAAAGERLRIPSGSLDIVYPAGQATAPTDANGHIEAIARAYWGARTMQIDLMTDDSTPITDSGYSQQTYANWQFSTEAD